MRLACVALAALSIAGSGCVSIFSVRGAPPPCTDAYNMPIIDTVLFAAATTGFIVAAQKSKSETQSPDHPNISGADIGGFFAGVEMVGAGISALVGYTKVSHCRQVKATPPPPARRWNPDEE